MNVIASIYIEFAVSLTVGVLLVMIGYPPNQDKRLFRIFLSLAIIAASVVAAIFLLTGTNSATGRDPRSIAIASCNYLLIFAAVICAARICFRGSFLSILLSCAAGYAIKQFSENILYFLQFIPSFPQIASGTINEQNIAAALTAFYAAKALTFAACYTFIWFAFLRRFHRSIDIYKTNVSVLICAIVVQLTCIGFNLTRVRFADVSMPLNVICIVYDIMCSLLVIFLRTGFLERNKLEREVGTIQRVWKEKESQLKLFSDNVDIINIKYHDLKRSVALLKEKGELPTDEIAKEIEDALGTYDTKIQTGNATLDTILTQYNLLCDKHGIRFSCIADGKLLDFMSSTDLVALFGNIMENAVEAVRELPRDERSISLSVQSVMGMVSVHAENPHIRALVFKNGLPKTTKANGEYHGYGIKSIDLIAKKYCGTLTIDANVKSFRIDILFESN